MSRIHQSTKLSEETNSALLSHLVDISAYKFDDSDALVFFQALPLGTYEHPVHGTIEVTPEKVAHFVENFLGNAREIELDVDYDHKLLTTEAAGWIKDLQNRGAQGLWAGVQFLPKAMEQLKSKAYKYFSAEYQDTWTHPKTGKTYQDVMFGGALTNRPFIKDILPINLSEFIKDSPAVIKPTTVGESMDPTLKAALIKLYKLSESATDEQVTEAVEEEATKPDTEPVVEPVVLPVTETEEEKQLSELAKTNPVVARLLSEQKETRDRLALVELSHKLSDTTVKLSALNEKGKFAIPPSVTDQARDLIIRLNDRDGAAVLELLSQFSTIGSVELGERGRRNPNADVQSAEEIFLAEITKYASEQKISLADASSIVAAADPEGFNAYRTEVTNRN